MREGWGVGGGGGKDRKRIREKSNGWIIQLLKNYLTISFCFVLQRCSAVAEMTVSSAWNPELSMLLSLRLE